MVETHTEGLVLRGAAIVDPVRGRLSEPTDVVISSGRIVSVGAIATPGLPVVDASRHYLVPGFLDMHAHPLELTDPAGALTLMLANGITGFRQMSGSMDLLARRAAGALELGTDSPALLAMPGELLTPVNAGSADSVVREIQRQHEAGADFVKVGLVSARVFSAAQDEARRIGIPIVGHLPAGVDVAEASRRGIRAIEHLGPGVGTPRELKIPKARLLEALVARLIKRIVINPLARAKNSDVAALRHADDTFSEERARSLARQFVADGTWQSPTLIRVRTQQLADSPEYAADPNLRFMGQSTVAAWRSTTRAFMRLAPEARSTFRANYALQLRLVKLFDEEGVRMIAGSDVTGAAWEVPGFSLHQEFDELAAAGLSPLRVLQMTTIDGAEFLGLSDSLGTIATGKNADFVLLGKNPLESVENLHSVRAVVRAGKYFNRAALDALLDDVAAHRSGG